MIRPNTAPDEHQPDSAQQSNRSAEFPADHFSTDEPMPARMLNEFVYCPRLFYLEHVEGLFAHNQFTVEGAERHRRVDRRSDELPRVGKSAQPASSGDSSESAATAEPESIHARSVTLSSQRYGVVAKLDLIEAAGDMATPVDYKRGSPRKLDDGSLSAWDPERVQLCVQALVLRDNGYRCNEGILFYWETRQRVRVAIDDESLELTRRTIAEARRVAESPRIPLPLVDSPKCPNCSMVGICLPDETRFCAGQSDSTEQAGEQLWLFPVEMSARISSGIPSTPARIRQLVTSRDERRAFYLNTPGLFVGKRGEVLQVKEKSKLVQEVRLKDICQVNVMGPIQISTQAIQGLLQAEIPVAYFSMGGWFYGVTQPVGLKNIIWRREQFRAADNPRFCLDLARQLVIGKIRNQRTLLMRNHIEPPPEPLRFLKALVGEVQRCSGLETMLGLEGLAARVYFENLPGMLKVNLDQADCGSAGEHSMTGGYPRMSFDFQRRNRRPPRDPVNALLSLGYSLLVKDLTHACTSVGLDPFLGYYHQPRFGRPALALDLMEPFRPLIVDSAVLSAINQRMVQPEHFQSAGEAVALKPTGRKAFFQAYEQRMDQLVTHPLFGYRVSYRRMLEIQVRLLARVLLGEIGEYPVFVTR